MSLSIASSTSSETTEPIVILVNSNLFAHCNSAYMEPFSTEIISQSHSFTKCYCPSKGVVIIIVIGTNVSQAAAPGTHDLNGGPKRGPV